MSQTITVTLTDEQVQAALQDARYLYPAASNEELRAKLEDSATHGPGIYATVRDWRSRRVRDEENENRKTEEAAYEELFPPASPDPEPEPVAATTAAKTTRKKKA